MRRSILVYLLLAAAGLIEPDRARCAPRQAEADLERVEPPPTTRRTTTSAASSTRSSDDDLAPLPPIRLAKLDPNIEAADRNIAEAAEPSGDMFGYEGDAPIVMTSAAPQRSFQAGSFVATRILDESLSITDLDTFGTWALPLSERTPLLLTPGFGAHFFSTGDAPGTPVLPDVVYDFYLDVRLRYRHSDRWTLDLAVTPGWYSDLENGNSDALRIGARALSIVRWSPTLQLIGGIVYLDRDDYPFVPGAGIIWNPSDDIEVMEPSKLSLMPSDLLKTLNEDEVLDLLAYLLSRGNEDDEVFK